MHSRSAGAADVLQSSQNNKKKTEEKTQHKTKNGIC